MTWTAAFLRALLVLGCLAVWGAHGQTLINGKDVTTDVCFSSTGSLRLGSVTLTSPPTERVVIFDALDTAPMITISCVNFVVVASSAAAAANDPTCAVSNVLFLCHASSSSASDWQCEQIDEFVYANAVTVTRGSTSASSVAWRIELKVGPTSASCYPRSIQMVAIISLESKTTGNIALLVVVCVLLGLVAVCFGVMAFYSLRKHVQKRQRTEEDGAVKLPEGVFAMGPPVLPGVEGQFPPQPLPIAEVRALYLQSAAAQAHHVSADGILSPRFIPHDNFEDHIAYSQKTAFQMDRHASLYERALTQGGDINRMKDPVRVWSPTEHPDALDPITAIPFPVLERAERSPRRYNPTRDHELDKVVICADCGVVVQDQAAPKYCTKSGRRHY